MFPSKSYICRRFGSQLLTLLECNWIMGILIFFINEHKPLITL
ncbi:rCG41051 [Rattus norvegicus]|uniref:RCG41051 n=1 Tax=Rattus norvegicus TaxID=10116 RepID=A6K267_RAT|nr:rCG41051 [Rattus norvegicus]